MICLPIDAREELAIALSNRPVAAFSRPAECAPWLRPTGEGAHSVGVGHIYCLPAVNPVFPDYMGIFCFSFDCTGDPVALVNPLRWPPHSPVSTDAPH